MDCISAVIVDLRCSTEWGLNLKRLVRKVVGSVNVKHVLLPHEISKGFKFFSKFPYKSEQKLLIDWIQGFQINAPTWDRNVWLPSNHRQATSSKLLLALLGFTSTRRRLLPEDGCFLAALLSDTCPIDDRPSPKQDIDLHLRLWRAQRSYSAGRMYPWKAPDTRTLCCRSLHPPP